jgi:hypothetical protein
LTNSIECPKCEKQIAGDSKVCVYCNAYILSDLRCSACAQLINWNELLEYREPYLHKMCRRSILSELACKVCSKQLRNVRNSRGQESYRTHHCTDCGHRNEIVSCRACGYDLILGRDVERHHVHCSRPVTARKAETEERRRRERRCLKCGRPLGLIHRILRHVEHPGCAYCPDPHPPVNDTDLQPRAALK